MPTLKRPLRRPRAALGWLAMLLAAVVAGCGPGVGGTGTGDTASALAYFGASPASLCSSELAALAACQHDGTTATPVPGAGPVLLADAAAGARVRVRLLEDSAELVEACTPLEFRGQWGVIAGQAGRFYGHTDPDAAPMPATLEAQASGAGMVLTLRDGEGRVLLGPVTMTATAAAPETPVCP
jgi:hypothetical protein